VQLSMACWRWKILLK